jgi:hypothetical protein
MIAPFNTPPLPIADQSAHWPAIVMLAQDDILLWTSARLLPDPLVGRSIFDAVNPINRMAHSPLAASSWRADKRSRLGRDNAASLR